MPSFYRDSIPALITPCLLLLALLQSPTIGRAQVGTPAQLSCAPTKMTSGDTLILRFRVPHPRELAIRAPGNHWYFLVYDSDKSTPKPIVDGAAFAKMSEMRLPVATALGVLWEGDHKNERIFQRSGTYEVVLTNVLESEGVPSFRCKVNFSGGR